MTKSKQYFDIGKVKQREGTSKAGEPYKIRTLNVHANEKTISSLKKLVSDLEALASDDTLQSVQKNIELSFLAPGSEKFPAEAYEKNGVTHTTLNKVSYVVDNSRN